MLSAAQMAVHGNATALSTGFSGFRCHNNRIRPAANQSRLGAPPMYRLLLAAIALFLAVVNCTTAEDWPMWRGPRLDGSSLETGLPFTWSEHDNIAWKTPIPGVGHSSPIVAGDNVFVTTCLIQKQARVLFCLDRKDGRIVWERELFRSPLEPVHARNSRASSTPASDGTHVFTSFCRLRPRTDDDAPPAEPREKSPIAPDLVPEMVVSSYDFAGNKVWEKIPGRFYSRHGFCSSPILHKDLVIVNGDQDALAYIVALDRHTGKEVWRADRPRHMRSYCVPLIVEAGGRTQMVLSGNESVMSYDPDTGKPFWHIPGPTEQYVASLVWGDGAFFLTAGFPDYHNMAITPDGQVRWHESKTSSKKASYVPSPLAVPGYFWMISDEGWLSCFNARTGKRSFLEKVGGHVSASPVFADGHVYLPDDDGVTHVLKAGGRFEVVADNALPEKCSASPAIAHGQIFLRTWGHLYCIGKK
jgi:outer membrane protein assembly factor BamB